MKSIAKIDCRRMVGIVALVAALAYGDPAAAALRSVSGLPNPAVNEVLAGGNPTQVAISLAHGFPLWYRDTTGLKLELCLEKGVTNAATGLVVNPCLTAEPILTSPISFPGNFGAEAFYWAVEGSTAFTSTPNVNGTVRGGSVLLVLAQEAAFLNTLPFEGDQQVFGRTRLRIDVPVAGTYRVTYPFGTRDYVVTTAVDGDLEINQTQDIGVLTARDFLASLSDGPLPAAPPDPADPSTNAEIVNLDGRSVGPFLEGAPLSRFFDTNGNQYLAEAGTELNPVLRTIQAGVNGVDYFEIKLLESPPGSGTIPAGFQLDANNIDQDDNPNTVRVTRFMVMGKVFNDGPNLPPVALPDRAGTTRGVPVVINVGENDTDNPVPGTNVHGINPNALGVVIGNQIVRSSRVTVGGGATLQRTTDLSTGKSSFLFSPLNNDLAVGEHTFSYVIQDKGGLISTPATVTVTVEDLAVDTAEYRPRTGKWRIGGTSSDVTANTVTLHGGPRATLTGDAEVPAVVTDAGGMAALRVTGSSIEFLLDVDRLPATAITAAHIHVGAVGADGPIIFNLFNSATQGIFPGTLTGTLTAAPGQLVLQPAAGVASFSDAVNAILAGNAYVNVHTVANLDGEIRGQLTRPLIGSAAVGADGSWEFSGKSTAGPGALGNVTATSDNGVRVLGVPLKVR